MKSLSGYMQRNKVNSPKELTQAQHQRCLQDRLPYITGAPWLIYKLSSSVAMDTAVPRGPAPMEERPRLINASCSGAAQSWSQVKTNKRRSSDNSENLDREGEVSWGAIKRLPLLRGLEEDEDLPVDRDPCAPCRGGE